MNDGISIEVINELIDSEVEFAKKVNPVMALGMEQIKRKLNNYYGYKMQQKELEDILNSDF